MADYDTKVSRRTIVKGLGIAIALTLAPGIGNAQQTTATAQKAKSTHRILTCNILLASQAHDGTPAAWPNRRELCEKIIRKQDADIICMQEVLRVQAEDMAKDFPKYESFGFPGPHMDAHPDGYHLLTKNVIMYRKDRYEMTSAGQYWLSETPVVAASVSWDALRARHATWLRLKDRKTGQEFRVIDTHFDHKAKEGLVHQAEIINRESAPYANDFPQILTGDFNEEAGKPGIKEIKSGGWIDTYAEIHGPEDPGNTYHKLLGPKHKSKAGKIDFIFYKGDVEILDTKIIYDNENGRYPSDHYFVSADVKM